MRRSTVLLMWLSTTILAHSAIAGWTTPVPLTEVNSSAEEWSPFLSYDSQTLYFARVRSDDFYEGRIFQATRDPSSGSFTNVQEVPGPLNSSVGHVFCEWVSPDNLRMYYENQVGSVFTLMMTERASAYDPWPQGTPISELNAWGSRLTMPRLTPDELSVVFNAQDIPGGYGGYDMWMSVRDGPDSAFGDIKNLAELNTTANEGVGTLTPDGLRICFASDRNGKTQIFQATRKTLDSPFGSPVHLSVFDIPGRLSTQPWLASDGSALYFMSSVIGDRSTRDIWVSYNVVPTPSAFLLGALGLIFAGWRLRERDRA